MSSPDTLSPPEGADFVARPAEDVQQSLSVPESKAERSIPPHGIYIASKRLYHGSNAPGIDEFYRADEDTQKDTVGHGLYLTSESRSAASYAEIRAHEEGGDPVLYEVDINDMIFADLTKAENLAPVLDGFKRYLEHYLPQRPDIPYYTRGALLQTIGIINKGTAAQVGRLAAATQTCGALFSAYLEGVGYDGLIAIEGGERQPRIGEVKRVHDSYVVFDPGRARVQGEHSLRPLP